MLVAGIVGFGAPAVADTGTYTCTVLVGTEVPLPTGGSVAASATSSLSTDGGVGECELHTIQERSRITAIQTGEDCQLYADTDPDAFVETSVVEGEVYYPGTSLIAFCEVGSFAAENEVSMVDI